MLKKINKLVALTLTLIFLLRLAPQEAIIQTFASAGSAGGAVCQIIRGGAVVGSYNNLGDALATETIKQPLSIYHGNGYTQLRHGDTIKLLADINYTKGIFFGGPNTGAYSNENESSCLGEITIDLNGYKLNISSTDNYALYLEHTFINVIHDKPGSEFNVSVEQDEWCTAIWALRKNCSDINKSDDEELSYHGGYYNGDCGLKHAGISYLTSVTATGRSARCIHARDGLFNIKGDITANGTESAKGIECDTNVIINVGGNVSANNTSGGTFGRIEGIELNYSSVVNVDGNVYAENKNGYARGVFIQGIQSDYNELLPAYSYTKFTVRGNVVSDGNGVECTGYKAEAEIFGNVMTNSRNDEYRGIFAHDLAKVVVHGNVVSNYTGVQGIISAIYIAGDVTSLDGIAVVAENAGFIQYDTDSRVYETIFDETRYIHVGGNVTSHNSNSGVLACVGSRVVIDGEIITDGGQTVEGREDQYMQKDKPAKAEIVKQPARYGYTTYQITSLIKEENEIYGYVWVYDPNAPPGAFISSPIVTNGTKPGKAYVNEGDAVNITMEGTSGGTAFATVTYLAEKDLSLTVKTVALTEDGDSGKATNIYRGSFNFEGMADITSVAGSLDIKDMDRVTAEALKIPRIRNSQITVHIKNQYRDIYPEAEIAGLLTAASGSGGNSVNVSVTDEATVVIGELPANGDYTLELRGLKHGLLGRIEGIEVKSGQATEVTLIPEIHGSNIFVQIVDETGVRWPRDERLIITDAATGEIKAATYMSVNAPPKEGYITYPIGTVLELDCSGGVRQVSVNGQTEARCYIPLKEQITVAPSGNDIVIEYKAAQMDAELSGTAALDGKPVVGASVNVSQDIMGSYLNFTATTDENGFYSLPVYPGFATTAVVVYAPGVEAAYESKQKPPVTLVSGEKSSVNFELVKAMIIKPDIRLFTQYLGEAEPSEQPWDRNTVIHFGMKLYNPRTMQTGDWSSLSSFSVIAGDRIILSFDRSGSIFAAIEYELTVAADGSVTQNVLLKQEGALINVKLIGSNEGGPTISKPSINLSDPAANRAVRYNADSAGGESYRIWVEKPGNYKLDFYYNGLSATREISVREGQISELGDVIFAERDNLSGTGQVTVSPAISAPGGIIAVRASYEMERIDPGKKTLNFQIPAGTKFLPGSLTLNNAGLPDPETDDSGSFPVDLPDSEAMSGFTIFCVQIDENIDATKTFAAASYGSVYLGSAEIEVETLTLSAPEYAFKRDITVKGFAPAGSAVKIYNRGAFAGSATATPAGNWSAKIILPGTDGVKRLHELYAETEINGVKRSTSAESVIYDPNYPQISKLFVTNYDNTVREVDASVFPAAFPYVYMPYSYRLEVAAEFTDNGAVEDVVFYMESGGFECSAPGVYNPEKGVYEARLDDGLLGPNKGASIGHLFVDYNPVKKYTAEDIARQNTEAEIRNQLPGSLSGFVIEDIKESTLPDGAYLLKMDIRLNPGDDITTIEFTMKETELQNPVMTDDEKEVFNKTGIPVYNINSSCVKSDGYLNMSFSAVTDASYFESIELIAAGNLPGVFGFTPVSGGPVIELLTFSPAAIFSPTAIKGIAWGVNIVSTGVSAESIWDSWTDKRISTIRKLTKECNEFMPGSKTIGLWERQNDLRSRDQARIVFTALGIAALFISGPVGIGITAVLMVGNYATDAYYESGVNSSIKNYYNECKASAGKRGVVVDFHWIYDPSGVVYEVTADEPLEGVTATALWLQNDIWEIWDAEFYEQENPYITGSDGWYEWDVPNGLWKIMYEKEGYRTEYSEEMTVPPIRTDVNIPLESIYPATVYDAYFSDGCVDIIFDKYVLASDINDNNLSVYMQAMTSGGEDMGVNGFFSGVFAPLDAVEYNGRLVAKEFRFTPLEKLEQTQYFVSFMPNIRSYAGVPLGFDGDGEDYYIVSVSGVSAKVRGVTLDAKYYYLDLSDGSPVQAAATVLPANAADKSVIWRTSDAKIATVDENGLISPVGAGSCVLTVITSDGGFEASAAIDVGSGPKIPVTGVSLDKAALKLTVSGPSVKLNATVKPGDATNKTVVWSACSDSIIKIDQEGNITPIGEGSCVVRVTTIDGEFWAECVVTVSASDKNNMIPVIVIIIGAVILLSGAGIILALRKKSRKNLEVSANKQLNSNLNSSSNEQPNFKFCTKCGAQIKENTKFCANCGTKINLG